MEPKFETVIAEPQSSFRCARLKCHDFTTDHSWHYHPQIELTWVVSSEGTRFVGDNIERYYPGDLVLCGPNLPHCWRDEPNSEKAAQPEWVIAQFDAAIFGRDLLSVAEAAPIRELLSECDLGIAFGAGAWRKTGALLQEMVESSGMKRVIRLLEVLDILAVSPGRRSLARADYRVSNELDQTYVERISVVQDYIRENLAREISQGEIAQQLGLSASAFSKFFRAATGQTFMGLVKILRVNEACRLLAGQERVAEIARACGYNSVAHFDQQFQEVKGITPSQYRRETRLMLGS